VVENRAGAGGMIGTSAVAMAPPDGYTLLLVSPTSRSTRRSRRTCRSTRSRTSRQSPLLPAARYCHRVDKTPREIRQGIIRFSEEQTEPDHLCFSRSRSINQISTELIALSAGVRFMHVPYKGGAPALNDLVGGHVDIFVSSLPQVLPLAQSGQAKALAVTSAKRTALLPDVPTLEESGISGFDLGSWWGIAGPARMPANVVNALNTEIGKILASPNSAPFSQMRAPRPNHDSAAIRRHDAFGNRALDQGRARGKYFDRLAAR